MKKKDVLTFIAASLGATTLTLISNAKPASAINVTFETDFTTGAGVGTILEQGDPAVAQIFTYAENNVFFTASPFDNPADSPSHFHLFDFVAEPSTNIDLLMGSDAAGLSITLGGATPTTSFTLNNLDLREVRAGGDVIFEGFNSEGSTGTLLLVAETTPGPIAFDQNIFGDVNRVDVYYAVSGIGGEAPDGAGIVFDNVNLEAVPEATTALGSVLVFGLGILITKRHKQSGKTVHP